MKRLLSFLIIISMLSTTLFAGVGVSVSGQSQDKNFNEFFLDVDGNELSDEEMEDVEGYGFFVIFAMASGVFIGISSLYKMITGRNLAGDIHKHVVTPVYCEMIRPHNNKYNYAIHFKEPVVEDIICSIRPLFEESNKMYGSMIIK